MNTNSRGTKNGGFTLVELLVVITIIGILVSLFHVAQTTIFTPRADRDPQAGVRPAQRYVCIL